MFVVLFDYPEFDHDGYIIGDNSDCHTFTTLNAAEDFISSLPEHVHNLILTEESAS